MRLIISEEWEEVVMRVTKLKLVDTCNNEITLTKQSYVKEKTDSGHIRDEDFNLEKHKCYLNIDDFDEEKFYLELMNYDPRTKMVVTNRREEELEYIWHKKIIDTVGVQLFGNDAYIIHYSDFDKIRIDATQM